MLASSHIDRVGAVDVVASGDTAKRMLKLPYSNVSFLIATFLVQKYNMQDRLSVTLHRIGNTLLVDNFDGAGARRMAADMVHIHRLPLHCTRE